MAFVLFDSSLLIRTVLPNDRDVEHEYDYAYFRCSDSKNEVWD